MKLTYTMTYAASLVVAANALLAGDWHLAMWAGLTLAWAWRHQVDTGFWEDASKLWKEMYDRRVERESTRAARRVLK